MSDKTDIKEIQITKTVKVKPLGVPFRCVVCNTFGTLSHGTKTCHACEGKGYILVPADEIYER